MAGRPQGVSRPARELGYSGALRRNLASPSLTRRAFAGFREAGTLPGAIVRLSPLLALYVLAVLLFSSEAFVGDESGYVELARGLANGRYSLGDRVEFYWGPGYPLMLLPFVWLGAPLLAAKLLNALFLFGAALYSFCTFRLYMSQRPALAFALLIGLYPPHLKEIHLLLTEPFAFFLVAGFAYHFCRFVRAERSRWPSFLLPASFLGYLALTKIIFGYVIVVGIVAAASGYSLTAAFSSRGGAKLRSRAARVLAVFAIAISMCLPYLLLTYSLIGRVFYWSNSGGMQLYWMSTPYQNEYGDWFNPKEVAMNPQVARNHEELIAGMAGLSSIQQDDAFKAQALQNIRQHPTKYLQNWLANIGRLLFNYPFSYTPQRLTTFFYLVPNMFIVVLATLLVYPAYRGRRRIPFEVNALLLLGLVALFGSSLLSAWARQFQVLVPLFGLWMAFVLTNIVRVEIRR